MSPLMAPLKDHLDRIAERYLLEDFPGMEASLASLSVLVTAEADRGVAAQLADAARHLQAAPEDDAARQRFESALKVLGEVVGGRTAVAVTSSFNSNSVLSQDPELVGDFLLEAREHLQNVEAGLLVIEKDPAHRETLHSVFRSFHTIKGLAGFLEFEAIQQVSHEVETILDLARNGAMLMTPVLIDLTLEGSDFVSRETNRIEAELRGELIPAQAHEDLVRRLTLAAHADTELDAEGATEARTVAPTSATAPADVKSVEPTSVEATSIEPTSVEPTSIEPTSIEATPAPSTEPLTPALPAPPPTTPAPTPPTPTPSAPAVPTANASPAAAPLPENASQAASQGASKRAAAETHAIRVDTSKLDYLLDMVGEMVIAESMVRLDPELAGMKNARLQRNLTQLRRVTEEVQKIAMATRMVPVGSLFQRVNRLVRDTCRKAGKLAEVEFFGEDTQLDKTIIEELTDPIMHMVRNSIDHGIETPEQRQASGKNRAGTIQLKAYRQADHIQIEIVDDGRGLNKDKILAKAAERGLIQEGATLADSDIFQLIFEPGFSTAEKVTDLSGRGVGMDVVKKQIQKLRGKIDIQSQAGRGATFFLKLPLTLAIIEGLVVGVGRERFIVPIYSVQEMFRPADGQVNTVQGKGEMVMVRNALLPVVRLEDALHVAGSGKPSQDGLMIVAETEGKRFVLLVDEFIGKQEVVIKSLGSSLKNTSGVAGGAILGDGRVGLILDLEAIYRDRHHRDTHHRDTHPRDGAGNNAGRKESVCVQELALAIG
jgi:two-component system, chemotaxis family, sensor kinase CheA